MAEFGPNGAVITPPSPQDYTIAKPKLKRVGLACFLCGVAACLSVALIGLGMVALGALFNSLFMDQSDLFSDEGLVGGVMLASVISMMNWWFCYLTIPAAWLAIGLSIGRFPRRGIIHAAPYFRWSAIWGAVLVGGTSSIFTGLVAFGRHGRENVSLWLSGTLTGLLIGAIAGLICGWLFRAIVRPTAQVTRLQVEVF